MVLGARRVSEVISELKNLLITLLISTIVGCHHRDLDITKKDEIQTQTISRGFNVPKSEDKEVVTERQTLKPEINYRPLAPNIQGIENTELRRGFIPVSRMNESIQQIGLDHNVYKQGEVAVLRVHAVRPLLKAKIKFLKRGYRLYENAIDGNGLHSYETFLAIPINADTGKHVMVLTYLDEGGAEEFKREFEFTVIEGDFREADTSEVDLPMLTEETMALLRYEHRYFARGYLNSTKEKLWTENFIWPARGKITGLFGISRKYNEGKDRWTHKAIDISSYVGARVVACNDGIISMVEDLEAHGKCLMIDHGAGVHSVYLHMDTVYVKKGDIVKIGQRIGKMGETGFCTGPNLHWQVMVNRIATDPRIWLAPSERERNKGEYVRPIIKNRGK